MHQRRFLRAPRSPRRAFTLIELLVVIAIIAILAIVVVLTLNPSELLKQSRDANRVSDMATLNSALNLYVADQGSAAGFSLGNASSAYVSLPDATISGNATSSCASLGLPSLAASTTYQCASLQSYRDTDGTGWVPVSFQNLSGGSPFGNLPIDPVNATGSGLFYSYAASGTQYEASSLLESQKYRSQYAASPLVPSYPGVNAKGNSLAISQIYNPSGLVGYWPMDEGVGSTTADQSGSGNAGTWSGTPAGSGSTYYGGGKVGSSAGSFNGTNDFVSVPGASAINFNQASSVSVSLWINPSTVAGTQFILDKQENVLNEFVVDVQIVSGQARFEVAKQQVSARDATSSALTAGNWYHLVGVSDGTNISLYVNGALQSGSPLAIGFSGATQSVASLYLGKQYQGANWYSGLLDDVRIYNRALSAAEIQALYNAEK